MDIKKYSILSILVCIIVGVVIIFTGLLSSFAGKIALTFASGYAYISIKRLRDLKKS